MVDSRRIFCDPHAEAGIIIAQTRAMLKGTNTNHVTVDEQAVHLSGIVNLNTQKVKYTPLFVLQKPLRAIIPSCLGTPTPMAEIDMPLESLQHIAAGAAEMMALCGMMGAAATGTAII